MFTNSRCTRKARFLHEHSAMQEMMGQIGFLWQQPQKEYKPRVDHDYG